jgi:hypothetical protein
MSLAGSYIVCFLFIDAHRQGVFFCFLTSIFIVSISTHLNKIKNWKGLAFSAINLLTLHVKL